MTTLPDKLIYPKPFAGGTGAVLTPFSDAVDGDKVNFETGFPSVYSAPKSNGGKFVTRGEMNYLGNIATKNDYYRMCGGINTFDPVFAQKIGGYPKDAILDYFDGVNLFKVISLAENNMQDFRSGVFGGKWAKLGSNEVLVGKYLLASYTDLSVNFNEHAFTDVGSFSLPKSGIISIEMISYSAKYTSGSFTTGDLMGTAFLGRIFDDANQATVVPTPYISGSNDGNYNNYSIIGGLSTSGAVGMNASTIKTPNTNIIVAKSNSILRLFIQNGFRSSYNGGDDLVISFNIYIQ